jgi:hypothetical protein
VLPHEDAARQFRRRRALRRGEVQGGVHAVKAALL